LVIIHIIFLHDHGSSNPIGIVVPFDSIHFHPYYTIKDIYGIFLILVLFFMFVFFYPEVLGHSDNYIKANPLVTPEHIVPE
jgi:quinol-cytochrome oxidoreductase complex cytochrome b subunit